MFGQDSLKHLSTSIISKLLETDGLRTVVQYDIVGVRYFLIFRERESKLGHGSNIMHGR